MDPIIIQTWVHEVTQSQLGSPRSEKSCECKQNVLVDMDPNVPRRTRRKQGGSSDENRRRQSVTHTKEKLDKIIGLQLQRGDEEGGSENVSIPDLYAVPRAKRTVSTRTYRDILPNADGSPTRLSHVPRSASSSRSSQSTRSTSPVKRAQDLRKLQKPVRFTRQSPRNLAAILASSSVDIGCLSWLASLD
ncbi:hypothetical protein HD806DRAFT_515845 [Xylariaceae sp. AK1471]|nr:hypothetical protein HD806DRAFT_515845 [Xylariaceae sp. AK1471]